MLSQKTSLFLVAASALAFQTAVATPAVETTNVSEAAQPKVKMFSQALASPNQENAFSIFAPQAYTKSTRIDYSVWDEALKNVVLRLGQSVRIRAKRPDPETGTRQVLGHKTAYRLEGSRVTFSRLTDEYRSALTEYRRDLERIANLADITHFGRNEQLAFWLNLHNVLMIEQIATNYPVRRPEELRVGPNNELLNDAKLLTIKGRRLSLRDIRENIVYANWSNPDVMYGFFRGNIGSPALQSYAYTGDNVNDILKIQGVEFVNSLRGFHKRYNARRVSALYEEVRPFYFSNWPNDLKAHLESHADDDVKADLQLDRPFEFDRYDQVVADLQGGDRTRTTNLNIRVDDRILNSQVSPQVVRLLRELEDKTEIMKQRGMIAKRGVVTIEDIATIDVDIPETVTEAPQN